MLYRTAMLVDDDLVFTTMLSRFLQQKKLRVHSLKDGRAAKSYLLDGRPDIVICDVVLPYHSGFELVKFIRKELELLVPIIMISSIDSENALNKSLVAGANVFLPKPLDLGVLSDQLAHFLKLEPSGNILTNKM
ncbi:MAG: PleD family two-component system response regulator [Flavobacteriaceae bacterium]